jgi:hypothetical protein
MDEMGASVIKSVLDFGGENQFDDLTLILARVNA